MKRLKQGLSALSAVIVFLTVGCLIYKWPAIPNEIPQHYNGSGVADAMGDKSSLVLPVFIMIVLFALSRFCRYLVKIQYQGTEKQSHQVPFVRTDICLRTLELVLVLCFAYIIYQSANGRDLGTWFLPVMLIAIAASCIGMCIGKKTTVRTKLQPGETGIVYRSKIDWWMAVLLWGCVISCVPYTIISFKEISAGSLIGAVIYDGTMAGLILPMLLDTKYILYEQCLQVRCAYFCKINIPYHCIEEMKPTHNPLASSALSLDRIEIRWREEGKHEFCMVSPVRKEEFCRKVNERRDQFTTRTI